MIHDLVYSRY